jgi:hypothetical protein
MFPENVDQILCMHILLKLQQLNPQLIGEIVDILDLTPVQRNRMLSRLLVRHPETYFYLIDLLTKESPER